MGNRTGNWERSLFYFSLLFLPCFICPSVLCIFFFFFYNQPVSFTPKNYKLLLLPSPSQDWYRNEGKQAKNTLTFNINKNCAVPGRSEPRLQRTWKNDWDFDMEYEKGTGRRGEEPKLRSPGPSFCQLQYWLASDNPSDFLSKNDVPLTHYLFIGEMNEMKSQMVCLPWPKKRK